MSTKRILYIHVDGSHIPASQNGAEATCFVVVHLNSLDELSHACLHPQACCIIFHDLELTSALIEFSTDLPIVFLNTSGNHISRRFLNGHVASVVELESDDAEKFRAVGSYWALLNVR